ncbi:DUF268 domain-containing protein [bacterium]|nr:DUF268 domain-containing protein [bacterium]
MNNRLDINLVRQIPYLKFFYRLSVNMSRRVSFLLDYSRFKKLSNLCEERFQLRWSERLVFLNDRTTTTGFDRHYVYHPAWAARVLKQTCPTEHVDISSTLHFVSLVSAFIPVRFYDFRPADLHLPGLTCEQANLLALPFPDNSVESLSCMHVVEHVGLGRYGDPLDPEGDLKSMRELQRVISPGGTLLFVVPVGKPRICFNGHRIYAYQQIVGAFSDLILREFTLIPERSDRGGMIPNATQELVENEAYGCGCFWFTKGDTSA